MTPREQLEMIRSETMQQITDRRGVIAGYRLKIGDLEEELRRWETALRLVDATHLAQAA